MNGTWWCRAIEPTRDRLIALVSVLVAISIFTMAIVASLRENGSVFGPRPCANISTAYSKFHVSACPDFRGHHCKLTAGKPTNIKLDFKTPEAFQDAVAYTKLDKIVDLFFLRTVGGHCPAQAGDQQHLSWNVVVPNGVEAHNKWVDLLVGVRLTTADEFLICYTLPARIYPP